MESRNFITTCDQPAYVHNMHVRAHARTHTHILNIENKMKLSYFLHCLGDKSGHIVILPAQVENGMESDWWVSSSYTPPQAVPLFSKRKERFTESQSKEEGFLQRAQVFHSLHNITIFHFKLHFEIYQVNEQVDS